MTENKEEYARALAAKAEKCVKLMKRFLISALVLAAALAVFLIILYILNAFYAPSDGGKTLSLVGAAGVIVLLACILGLAIAVISTYAAAKCSLNKLGALDKEN